MWNQSHGKQSGGDRGDVLDARDKETSAELNFDPSRKDRDTVRAETNRFPEASTDVFCCNSDAQEPCARLGSRVQDVCTENPKSRFLLPIRARNGLEGPSRGSAVEWNSSVGPITYRVDRAKNRSIT